MRQVDAAQGSGYIPTLDGMRAVSIALVVLGHFGRHVVDNDGRRGLFFLPGVFGVTIFFFISGYLITGHLLAEVDRTGTVSLPLFYLRRMLRLYPALLVMVTVGGVLFWALGGWLHGADVLSAVFYFVNIREILGGFITATPTLPHPYSVLWSLSVEEHYYLVFPLLVVLLARRRMAFIATLTVLILAGTAWRWHIAGLCLDGSCVEYRVEYGTDTRIDSILYGALLASLLCSRLQSQTLRITANLPALIVGLALILFSLADRDPWFRETERFTFQGIGLLLAMGAVLPELFPPRVRDTGAARVVALPAAGPAELLTLSLALDRAMRGDPVIADGVCRSDDYDGNAAPTVVGDRLRAVDDRVACFGGTVVLRH